MVLLTAPQEPRRDRDSDWLCQPLIVSHFLPLQSLETVSYRRSCHPYCPCRHSHRPRTMGSIAHCGGVGSASRTETLSQLTRLLVSLLLNTHLSHHLSFFLATWSPRLPAADFPGQTVLACCQSLSQCLDDLSYQVNMALNACCYAAPWWRGWKQGYADYCLLVRELYKDSLLLSRPKSS